jgi:hypothetical protein
MFNSIESQGHHAESRQNLQFLKPFNVFIYVLWKGTQAFAADRARRFRQISQDGTMKMESQNKIDSP